MNLYIEFINNLDLKKGDKVLIASSIKKLSTEFKKKGENLDLNILIDILQEKVGTEGTLMFPTYNWDFCRGVTFDYKNTKSQTGVFSQVALDRKDFKRTKHPIYSFAVWGSDTQNLYNLDNKSAFGLDSPFEYIYLNDFKMIIIDVGFTNSLTFIHYIEEKIGVKYRYIKKFKAAYIDKNGNENNNVEYKMYVRRLDLNFENSLDNLELISQNSGSMRKINFGESEIKLLKLNKIANDIEKDIIYNESQSLIKFITN